MSEKAIQGRILDPVPAYDRLKWEPNLDLIVTTRRIEDGPQAGTRWNLKNRKEGLAQALTKVDRDYGAAAMRLAANHLSHHPDGGTDSEIVAYEMREGFWQFRLSLDYFVDMVKVLVEMQGLNTTARLMPIPMSPLQVEELCRAKSSERPNLLAEIGAQNPATLRRAKKAKKVLKKLAPVELVATATPRRIPVKEALGLVG